jgi:acyl transferase domain-containing protein
MVALHEACRALQSGDASAAVVAGTSLIMTPSTTALFFNEGILSPDASCKTFDASADGFARAEGITAIYIKRLKDAVRDGNPIRAIIRATGSNSDGRSHGLMNPSAEAHEALMRKVYQQAGMDPSNTAFVEVSASMQCWQPWLLFIDIFTSATEPARQQVIRPRLEPWATSLEKRASTLVQ